MEENLNALHELGSREVARAAIEMSLTQSREEENRYKQLCREGGIRAVAVDYGGEFATAVARIVERAVVAARREGVIEHTHREEGAVAGATHEAITQLMQKASGFNVGGKIAVARSQDHVCVSLFLGIGLLHLNEMAIGLGHRAL